MERNAFNYISLNRNGKAIYAMYFTTFHAIVWLEAFLSVGHKTKFRITQQNYVQWTVRRIRLLTVGGTPLDAIQRYGPIWRRVIRVISSSGPTILPAATVYICRCGHTNSYGHGLQRIIIYASFIVQLNTLMTRSDQLHILIPRR